MASIAETTAVSSRPSRNLQNEGEKIRREKKRARQEAIRRCVLLHLTGIKAGCFLSDLIGLEIDLPVSDEERFINRFDLAAALSVLVKSGSVKIVDCTHVRLFLPGDITPPIIRETREWNLRGRVVEKVSEP